MRLECRFCNGVVTAKLIEVQLPAGGFRIRARCSQCNKHLRFVRTSSTVGERVVRLAGIQNRFPMDPITRDDDFE